MAFHSLTRRSARRLDQRGTGLLDVLLGMAIFALLIVIGMQNYSTYTKRATRSAVSADVSQLAVAIDQYMTDKGTAPPSAPSGVVYSSGYGVTAATYINAGAGSSATNLSTLTATLSPGVSVARYGVNTVVSGGYEPGTNWYVCLVHKGSGGKIDAWAGWSVLSASVTDSGSGTKTATSSTTPCGPVVDVP